MSPIEERRIAITKRFGLTYQRRNHLLTPRFIDQLDNCKDDAARRLLLGISRKK